MRTFQSDSRGAEGWHKQSSRPIVRFHDCPIWLMAGASSRVCCACRVLVQSFAQGSLQHLDILEGQAIQKPLDVRVPEDREGHLVMFGGEIYGTSRMVGC